MMKNILIATFLLFLSVLNPAQAQEPVHVQASLISPTEALVKGQTNEIGLYQEITEGWHTYWQNPGDSGLETTIEWVNPPKNIEIGDMIWPIPHAIPFETLVNYGYEGDVLFTIPVTIPADFTKEEITLNAKASWLVCKEICIPESTELSLTLPIQPTANKSNHAYLFEKAQESYPSPSTGNAEFLTSDDRFRLVLSNIQEPDIQSAHFFPYSWGIIPFSSPQSWQMDGTTLSIETDIDGTDIQKSVEGVVTINLENGKRIGYDIKALKSDQAMPPLKGVELSLSQIILFAILGGLILNLMPCVFPVLSMKALSLIQVDREKKNHIRLSGLSYTTGVLVSFAIIASLLLFLKASGEHVGWGFQLQSPFFVAIMALLLYLIGLNLTGFYDIGTSFMGMGQKLTTKDGHTGSFWTGVLATVVATPCTAPFMATALGATLVLPADQSFLIFLSLGFGMALPYLLLTFIPGMVKILPKPGAWMDSFKQFLSFPMMGFAIWLVWVLSKQTGTDGILYLLVIALLLTFGLWLEQRTKKKLKHVVFAMILIVCAYLMLSLTTMQPNQNTNQSQTASYEVFDTEKLNEYRSNNQRVLVNLTAKWCITCLANEQVALSRDKVQQALIQNNIIYMKGDWTTFNDEITDFLKNHGRTGVPLYVYYDEQGNQTILPQLLTPEIVLNTISK